MNLDFKLDEKDFFKAIGITEEDEKAFVLFKRMYYFELTKQFQSKKTENKLNDFQLKNYALKLSSHSKMLQTGLEWFKEHKRKDQMTVLLLGDIFSKLIAQSYPEGRKLKDEQLKKGIIN
jgi:hypothetical protein